MTKPVAPATPPERTEADLALRAVTRLFPNDFARGLLPAGSDVRDGQWIETQYAARERRLDRLLSLWVDRTPLWLHAEWMLAWSADTPLRMFEYNAMAVLAAAEVTDASEASVPAVESAVVVLTGPLEKPWPAVYEHRTSPEHAPWSGLRFHVLPVYQRTLAELRAMGDLWLVFAPLAIDASDESIRRVLDELRGRVELRLGAELFAAMATLADADVRHRGLKRSIATHLPREVIMQSTFLQELVAEGKAEGKAEGEALGKARSILTILDTRGLSVPDDVRELVLACRDHDVLDRWLKRALSMSSARAVVRPPRPRD